MTTKKCCFCGCAMREPFTNNAQPVSDGRCCGDCNDFIVIPARIARMMNAPEKKEAS